MVAGDFTLYGFTLPQTSPLLDTRNHYLFCASLVLLHGSYHALSYTIFAGEEKEQLKRRSWILTTIASAMMSAASLPYLYDIAMLGFDFSNVKPRFHYVADPLACFFVAYLLS